MKALPGTYALLMESGQEQSIKVGKLGSFLIPQGFYVYTGIAFGPGGLRSRVGRHLKTEKKQRWHVDYILNSMTLLSAWYTTDNKKKECEWAGIFQDMGGSIAISRFGSSDCSCESHLIYFSSLPDISKFKKFEPETFLQIFNK